MTKLAATTMLSVDGVYQDPTAPGRPARRVERGSRHGGASRGHRVLEARGEPWGDPPPFGMPVFVLTHEPREPQPMQGGTTYNFANIIRQNLKAGFIDEMEIHLVPVLLGGGVRLFGDLASESFELRRIRCIETPGCDASPLRDRSIALVQLPSPIFTQPGAPRWTPAEPASRSARVRASRVVARSSHRPHDRMDSRLGRRGRRHAA